jgi:pyruvate dehydrogenase E1 component
VPWWLTFHAHHWTKFAERFDIPVTKEDVKQLNFYKPAQDSEEMIYMNTQRQKNLE